MLPPAFYGRPKTIAVKQVRGLANSWRSATADCEALECAHVLLEDALEATGAPDGSQLEITSEDFSQRPSLRIAGQPNFDRARLAALSDCRASVKNVCDVSYELELTVGATHPYAVALANRKREHDADEAAVARMHDEERYVLGAKLQYERLLHTMHGVEHPELKDIAQQAVDKVERLCEIVEANMHALRVRLDTGDPQNVTSEARNAEFVKQQFLGHPHNVRLRGEDDDDDHDNDHECMAPGNEQLQVRLSETVRIALRQLTRDKAPAPMRVKAKRDAKKEAYREACNFVVYWTVARDRSAKWREMSDEDGKAWLALDIDGVPHKPRFQENGQLFRNGHAVMTWPDKRHPCLWSRLSLPKPQPTIDTEAQGVLHTLGHLADKDNCVWSSYRYECSVCGQNSFLQQQRSGPCAFCRAPSTNVTMHAERTIISLAIAGRPRMMLRREWGSKCLMLAGSGPYNLPWHHGDPRYVKSSVESPPGRVVELEVPLPPLDIATKRKSC